MTLVKLLACAAALTLITTASQAQGKKDQEPGASGYAPGHQAKKPGDAKKYAPGQQAKKPGDAKKYAPGQKMNDKKDGS